MLQKIYDSVFGNKHERALKKIQPLVEKINAKEKEMKALSDSDLKRKTLFLKEQLKQGKTLDDILVEAFAVVREASIRTLSMRHFDVQLIGGIILHQGSITEMKTGEGKTLVATLPVYLNSLTGNAVHVVTVNDYLAQRDVDTMSDLYEFLGLTSGAIVHGQSVEERKEIYTRDVIYANNSELGFDYLRDNMAKNNKSLVQGKLSFALLDEVDSILIDEARTPLIISAPAKESADKYKKYATLVPKLTKDTDYTVDEKSRSVLMTDSGVDHIESLLGITNIYSESGHIEVHHIEQALKAYTLYKKDTDYVVNDGEVVIVDEFTGRLMPGRRFGDGLHQAIEAKEHVEIKRESKTLASVTFQNFFRQYDKLSGMTGTAETEAEEFYQIYGVDTFVIPTNKPIARDDKPDSIYKTQKGKFIAVTRIVKEKHEKGQPCLVGTSSIDTSEVLSKFFKEANIPHEVLNAKHHEREAQIVSDAGQKGAITIATNMAGRGTDIKLGEGVAKVGGLCVIGSERHESRRIDNQLRGRSGRQGDPGESQFFVSMEDTIMRLFGGDRMKSMMDLLNVPEDMPIHNGMLSKQIENAQRRVEGHNFDARKHVLEYDDILAKQRQKIYTSRRQILEHDNLSKEIDTMFIPVSKSLVQSHIDATTGNYDIDTIGKMAKQLCRQPIELTNVENNVLVLNDAVLKHVKEAYAAKKASIPSESLFAAVEKAIYLRSIDNFWMEHLDNMTQLRSDVSLYGYGQRNPLMEYKNQAFDLFVAMMEKIKKATLQTMFHIEFSEKTQIKQSAPRQMSTNEDQIEGNLNHTHLFGSAGGKQKKKPHPRVRPVTPSADVQDRNAECKCASGKKYKKCCGK